MTGCPMAYPYACQTCTFHGQCPPSLTLEKLDELQTKFEELKQVLSEIIKTGN